MQLQVKQRNSNLELYRIIVMLLIVAHHCIWHSGVMELMAKNPLTVKSIFYYILGMWGKTGINCFVLITGYFMCKSTITVRKYLKLMLEVIFYNIIIYSVFVIANEQPFSLVALFFSIVPIQSVGSLFVPCFLLFYLFIPYLTILVSHLNKEQHVKLIALCLFIYTILATLPYFQVTINHITWYSILFFIASYIRNYGLFPQFSTSRWGGITLLSCLLSIICVVGVVYLDNKLGKHAPAYKYVSPSGICAVLTSVSSFMYFKNINIRNKRYINTIAAGTFGVLLIHDNCFIMRQWLWKSLVDVKYIYSLNGYASFIFVIFVIFAIFFVCNGIDIIRKYTIEKYAFKHIDKYLKY